MSVDIAVVAVVVVVAAVVDVVAVVVVVAAVVYVVAPVVVNVVVAAVVDAVAVSHVVVAAVVDVVAKELECFDLKHCRGVSTMFFQGGLLQVQGEAKERSFKEMRKFSTKAKY